LTTDKVSCTGRVQSIRTAHRALSPEDKPLPSVISFLQLSVVFNHFHIRLQRCKLFVDARPFASKFRSKVRPCAFVSVAAKTRKKHQRSAVKLNLKMIS
jgi:hypothetical protein